MSGKLNISSNPHVRDNISTRSIMLDVIIALIPASLFGIFNFGIRALLVILVTVASSVIFEMLFNIIMKKEQTADGSAIVTGLLLALNLPVRIPLWMTIIGALFAIIVVKQLFGGLGQNFMNPALAARCFMLISFAKSMTDFTYDGVSKATPLALLKQGKGVRFGDVFFGTCGGTIGETCVIALLIGGIYLAVKKIIDIRIPITYILVFVVFMVLFSGYGFNYKYIAKEVCGGGLLLGAIFMATDYVTSPVTHKGRIIFGAFLGIMTGLIRVFAVSTEGVSYAIIIGNLLVPIIDKISMPVAFGIEKKPLFGRKAGK